MSWFSRWNSKRKKYNQLSNEAYDLVKRITYTSDKNGDYWQTPKETLARLKGDCDDFAMLHYFTLLEKGSNPEFVIGINGGKCHIWVECGGYFYDQHHMVRTQPDYDVISRFKNKYGYDVRLDSTMDRMTKEA